MPVGAGRPATELHWRLAVEDDEANLGHRANLAIDEGHAAEARRLARRIEAEAEKDLAKMAIPAIDYARPERPPSS
jgi:hypothetical protein